MSPTSKPLVSVVTPFYNSDDYLAECIESILGQSYENFEYILVNNCSTDKSLKIAQNYRYKDERIRISNNKNFLTQVQNYNHALSLISSKSKYCKIVQADDWIYPHCLEQMVNLAEATARVGIVSSYCLLGSRVYLSGLPHTSTVLTGRDVFKLFLSSNIYLFGTPTSHLFRSDLVRNRTPFYDELSPVEDAEVCFDLLRTSDFAFVHQVLTFSRRDNESLVTSINTYEPLLLLKYIALKKYGSLYLNPNELHEFTKQISKKYFSYLAESKLKLREKGFWDYHVKGLASIGEELNLFTLFTHMIYPLLDVLLNPKSTVEKLYVYSKKGITSSHK